MKWLKFFIALPMLPICWGTASALVRLFQASIKADIVLVALGAGAACWLLVYFILPRPAWLYVLGHELTHAIWTWASGGSVKKLKASSKGGSVEVSKANFLTTLAPYFFPFYTVIIVMTCGAAQFFWNLAPYISIFHLLIGFTYAFHVTLTCDILRVRQTDITSQGYLFSAAVIWLGNLTVLLIALPLLTGITPWWKGFAMSWNDSLAAFVWLGKLLARG